MRRRRFFLTFLMVLAVLFDIQEAVLIYTHGWPPDKFAHLGNTGGLFVVPTVTTRDRVEYGLFLLAVALAQGVLARLVWKAWRKPDAKLQGRDD